MDNSIITPRANRDDDVKSKEVAKDREHSPARSSVKSFKTDVVDKVSTKSTAKLNSPKFNRFAGKVKSKSQTSLTKNDTQNKPSTTLSNKTLTPATSKSPNFKTTPAKSKIPSMQKSYLKNSSKKPYTGTQQKPPAAQKPLTPNVFSEKKEFEVKRPQQTRSTSKSSLCKSESFQTNKMVPGTSISKSSFITTNSGSVPAKRMAKSQSARLTLESLTLASKRSASILSTRSTPCDRKKEEHETNLRKMISTAGDYNKSERLDINLKPEFVQKDKNSKEILSENNTTDLVNKLRDKISLYMDEWFSSTREELNDADNDEVAKLQKLERLQVLKSNGLLELIDDWCSSRIDDGDSQQIIKLKKQLEDASDSVKKWQTKFNDVVEQQEERLKIEKALVVKAEMQLAENEEYIKELQTKLKSYEKQTELHSLKLKEMENENEQLLDENAHFREDLTLCEESLVTTNSKLQTTEHQLVQVKKELKVKDETIKKLENVKTQLESSLMEMTAKVEELQNEIKNKAHAGCEEHLGQISALINKVDCLEGNTKILQQHNDNLEQKMIELEKVREKLSETENKLQDVQKEYEAKRNSMEIKPNYSKEVQLEFAKFRQSDADRRGEIDKLKVELSKAQCNICQLEQQVQRDQQLLEVRSELINSLQTNEKTHRIHMEELFAQVGEKNTAINELNCKLQSKSEEARNFFTNLSAKQMEVANQEHIIKLLEESNERSQMLRVKQEEKIGRLEEELAHLKQTMAIYQANIMSGSSGKHLLYAPVLSSSANNVDYNENLCYYVSQRKRKRQVDINVKKYEA